jgi:hypothetical protein
VVPLVLVRHDLGRLGVHTGLETHHVTCSLGEAAEGAVTVTRVVTEALVRERDVLVTQG